ncbi:hypothetical protein F4679DRAFT_562410 [Xylaria curta]|nr:hypothetical protein F4679DRAFT_562410 [Xylaria curta]
MKFTLPSLLSLLSFLSPNRNLPQAQPASKAEMDRQFGLTQQYPDPNDTERTSRAAVDIIAIHGLRARSPQTWLAWKKEGDPESGNVFWLKDEEMLPRFIPDSRILTYDWNANYVKDASKDRFLGHADTLLEHIYQNRLETNRSCRPIIFIASCFGGLLLANALVRANEPHHPQYNQYHPILDLTIGIAFLGTPFRGSWMLGYEFALRLIDQEAERGESHSQELIQYLRTDSRMDARGLPSPLDDVVQRFSEMIHNTKFKSSTDVVCFYETLPTNYESVLKALDNSNMPNESEFDPSGHAVTVPRASACIDGITAIQLEVRHNMLHKHSSPTSNQFQLIVQRLQGFSQKSKYISYSYYRKTVYMPMQIRLLQPRLFCDCLLAWSKINDGYVLPYRLSI